MKTRFVALLRAINVAGIITMEETRRIFASLGFMDVSTVGASGNVVSVQPATMRPENHRVHRFHRIPQIRNSPGICESPSQSVESVGFRLYAP